MGHAGLLLNQGTDRVVRQAGWWAHVAASLHLSHPPFPFQKTLLKNQSTHLATQPPGKHATLHSLHVLSSSSFPSLPALTPGHSVSEPLLEPCAHYTVLRLEEAAEPQPHSDAARRSGGSVGRGARERYLLHIQPAGAAVQGGENQQGGGVAAWGQGGREEGARKQDLQG